MKKYIIGIITFLIIISASIFYNAQAEPVFRGTSQVESSLYKDSNQKLYGVVGKSQLINFDEDVKRISITDPTLADIVLISPTEMLLNGKKAGRTTVIFWGESGNPVFFNLLIQQDTDAFVQAVDKVAPNEEIEFVFTDDGVILSGKFSSTGVKKQVEDVVSAYGFKLVDLTESPTKQVLLEVKITEASRNFTRDFESKFNIGQNNNNFVTGVLGMPQVRISNGSVNNGIGQYVLSSSSANIAWALEAAETKGWVKILAEPKLLAINGEKGSFNVGNEIPIPSGLGQYGNISYSFKNTGVILNFTPTIMEKSNRIILKLSPEISEIDPSYMTASGVPGFKTRKVDTTVELADGETLVIAGLLSHNTANSRSKVPWLGDIPFLGGLFGSTNQTKNDTELVIFITPRIVDMNNGVNL